MDEIIAKIKKRGNSEIWIKLTTYKGKDKVDIREYYMNPDNSEFLPTKKGISVDNELISKIKELLNNLCDADEIGKFGSFELYDGYCIQGNQKIFNSHLYNEIRIYYIDKETGEWRPTNKGITFNPKLTEQILDALNLIEVN
jgi:hypothetical protein